MYPSWILILLHPIPNQSNNENSLFFSALSLSFLFPNFLLPTLQV